VSEAENSASPPRNVMGHTNGLPVAASGSVSLCLPPVLLLGTLVAVGIHGLPGSASDPAPLFDRNSGHGPGTDFADADCVRGA